MKLLSSGKVVDLVIVAHDDTAGDTNVFSRGGPTATSAALRAALDNAGSATSGEATSAGPCCPSPATGRTPTPVDNPGTADPAATSPPAWPSTCRAALRRGRRCGRPGDRGQRRQGGRHPLAACTSRSTSSSSLVGIVAWTQLTYVEYAEAHHGQRHRHVKAGRSDVARRRRMSAGCAPIVDAFLVWPGREPQRSSRPRPLAVEHVLRDAARQDHPPGAPLEVESRAITVTRRGDLPTNLDFRRPSGWVPPLGLSANFEAFGAMRQAALKLLYSGMTMEQKYDDLQRKEDVAEQAGKASSRLTQTVAVIGRATEDLARARNDVLAVKPKVLDKQSEIDPEALRGAGAAGGDGAAAHLPRRGQARRSRDEGLPGRAAVRRPRRDIAAAVGDIDITDPKNLGK